MPVLSPLFQTSPQRQARVAIFLSGSGSNAEKILQAQNALLAAGQACPYQVRALVTDAPEKSRAGELGRQYDLPVISEDIKAFYLSQGESRVSLLTARGQELRNQWSDRLRQKLAPLEIDFAVFAGFVPLTNLTADFPCLNVHPGDLTYLKDGRRHLVGLHTVPIERAILEGLDCLRSSVILAQPYTGQGEDMDSGPILGLSAPVDIDLGGENLQSLLDIQARRPQRRPAGGFQDRLEEIARHNQERLKCDGDWNVLPAVVHDFAAGRYALDERNLLYYRLGTKFHPVETVVCNGDERELLFRSDA
ncbi:MAG: hypothetical protein GX902_07065 [Lentisphaerae bacterium]|nr:hypothetical protein [Lentisphaerota bacterium]